MISNRNRERDPWNLPHTDQVYRRVAYERILVLDREFPDPCIVTLSGRELQKDRYFPDNIFRKHFLR